MAKQQWGGKKKNWKPAPPKVSRHYHVGHMIYTPDGAACRECGQVWDWSERGWVPSR